MEVKKVAVDEAERMGVTEDMLERDANRVRMTNDFLDMAMPAMSPTVAKLREARQRAQGLHHSTILRG